MFPNYKQLQIYGFYSWFFLFGLKIIGDFIDLETLFNLSFGNC